MEPTRLLLKTLHGSHLYGTNTENSDIDYKGIHLPSGKSIILQNPENVIDKSIESKLENGKNSQNAIDYQSISLQKFIHQINAGDSISTEILFTPNHAIMDAIPEWFRLKEKIMPLINSEIKGFTDYCIHHASKYSVKTDRFNAIKKLVDLIEKSIEKYNKNEKIEIILNEINEIAQDNEYINIIEIESGHDNLMKHIECCSRKTPITNNLETAFKMYNKIKENYGNRVKSAIDNEGIDWKNISHAIRMAGQAKELLEIGKITFPRPNAEYLIAIKEGKLQYKEIASELEDIINNLDKNKSVLPINKNTDIMNEIIDEIIIEQYQKQIQ